MKTLVLFLALLAAPFAASAGQLSSDFRGQVVDSHGTPAPGAVMVVEALETGRTTRHVANTKGRWHAQGLRSDLTYWLSCFAPGDDRTPTVQFQGRVLLGQIHVRNCVVGKLDKNSPEWLSSWKWKQPSYAVKVLLDGSSLSSHEIGYSLVTDSPISIGCGADCPNDKGGVVRFIDLRVDIDNACQVCQPIIPGVASGPNK